MTTLISTGKGDGLLFLKTWLKAPLKTAALSPSSAGLGQMAACEAAIPGDGPVVEFGVGTGALTAELVAMGVAPARLVLFESDPAFQDVLRSRYPEARVIGGNCYQAVRSIDIANAAAFVSGLPLVQEPARDRARFVLDCLDLMGRPSARFVQLTYLPVSPVPAKLLPGVTVRRSPTVWSNMPPARIFSYWRAG
jgi:phosphatidylethanolamine/phosphatidyl-N-methylethanolamine N-methyltransferase